VTVPSSNGRRHAGVVIHRSRTLTAAQITRRLGIPVTTPSRTLADLRRSLPQLQFARALREAEFLRLPVDRSLQPDHTRSELETRFLRLCRRHRIPQPDVNVRVGSFVVDFLWPSHCLVAELDGYRAHGGRLAFEADRARDLELATLGFRVVRITWRRLNDDLDGLVAALRHLLRK
jgi:very-short-patch-repair endonuclease